ncbi:hypothetical protein [Microbacterium sp. cx-59]|uniref:hypothetical protein n=1 Tax=Microbacterium sp. cx-59 TaxID=2891207 RepID=UPI001E445722|nr:hypothetical protein [Microbacterium sp. cx-59]MCC4907705.1 hypothetical protein [Microbacterium sp. cx-59]
MTRSPQRSRELCPEWCNGYHELSDDLRLTHRSNPTAIPAIERRDSGEECRVTAVTVDLIVGLEQAQGEVWVWIGPEDDAARSLAISFESAGRLNRALSDALASGLAMP